MKRLIIKTGTEDEFFARGRHIAKLADTGKPLPEEHGWSVSTTRPNC